MMSVLDDLQNVVKGKETPTVRMLDDSEKTTKEIRNEKNKKYFHVLFVIIGWTFVAYVLTKAIINKISLNKNFEYANAVVNGFGYVKNVNYVNYIFFVDSSECQGSWRYYPASEKISIGDTIMIVFDKTNPENNRLARDF